MDGTGAGPGGLQLTVFGGLVARRAGRELDLGGPRQRSVLARLLVARGAALTPARLADDVWDGDPPPSSTSALQAYLSRLRRALDPQRGPDSTAALVRTPVGYALQLPEDAVDLWRFERLVDHATASPLEQALPLLEQALALHRAPALQEWAGSRWADQEASRVGELRAVAAERLVAGRLELSVADQAGVLVPELESLVAQEPLREERWRLLALALYRGARQSDALLALRRARRVLREELGVDPGPALRELEAAVLDQDPRLLPAPRPPVRAAGPEGPPGPPGPAAGPPASALAERDGEVGQLRLALGEALSSSGATVLVEGPAGIGKSRLLQEAGHLARGERAQVLTARASALEAAFAFGVVRQLFEPLLVDPRQREGLLRGPAAPAAAVFDAATAPGDRAGRQDEQPDGRPGAPAQGAFGALHALYWLVVGLSSQAPLVLVVDDLQWADTSSLRFLAYLAHRLDGLPVLLVTAVRTGEQGLDAPVIAEIAAHPGTRVLRPAPLSGAAVAGVVRERLGEPDPLFTAACHRSTGGNPLLLRQVLRALQADGARPDSAHTDRVIAIGSRAVAGVVLLRLSRLAPGCDRLARAVAVLGDEQPLVAAAAMAGLDVPAAALAADVLAAAEIFREGHPLAFVHPLVREAVYRGVPAGERALAHEAAADVLGAHGASAEQVAAHLLHAPPRGRPQAAATLRQAARVAAGRGAPESAVLYLVRALEEVPEEPDRTGALLEVGELEQLTDGAAAIGHLREALARARSAPERARTAVRLVFTLVMAGPRGEAVDLARAERAALPVGPDGAGDAELDDHRQALDALARIASFMHGYEAMWAGDDLPEPTGDGPGARMLAVAVAWELHVTAGDLQRCARLCRWALEGEVLVAADPGLFWVIAVMTLELLGQDVEATWDDALQRAQAQGSVISAMGVLLWRGRARWSAGDLREAEHLLGAHDDIGARWAPHAIGITYARAFLAGVALDRGHLPRARELVEAARRGARAGDGAHFGVEAAAALALAEGRPREALDLLDPLTRRPPVTVPAWYGWRPLRARALAALGHPGEAAAVLREELALARAGGSARCTGQALRLLAEVAVDGAEALLREAVAVLTASTARLELARAQAALAAVVEAGDPREAAALRRSALELAEDCGAESLHRELTDLVRGGDADAAQAVRARRHRRLCATEDRAARLLAQGTDVHGIAAALFLTPVAVHGLLQQVKSTLQVQDDEDLAAALP
ncbi:BTAD domain-containing putative transcriptional regulator [Kineococcus aurantiacus]|uniref:DNA-binding SARP family transcriptional activator/DNA-binding NarL/FixJ family response regulator n=2 Tax=Kineococcus aurantiacus TaxID=37633 RepID=A0A7Y9DNB2_9ACTN|nr:DNA-binding SARP family transcriptional activator/DNA-binding NarL/FixJ family response regulator [Kineococcus aurantiacus]